MTPNRRGGYRIRLAESRNLFQSGEKIRVRVRLGRKLRNLGYFETEAEASKARNEYHRLMYGHDYERVLKGNHNFSYADLPGLDVYYDRDKGAWVYSPDRGKEKSFETKHDAVEHAEQDIRKREGMFAYLILGVGSSITDPEEN